MLNKRCLRPLICPLCLNPLQEVEKSLRCQNRHTFDISGDGYINLLVSRKKLPDSVGDSAEMLQARRAFLESGAFKPLSAQLNEIASRFLANISEPVVLDVGCGEGYYLEQLASSLSRDDICYWGLDVAKAAVRMGAKRKGYGRYLVADINKTVPIAAQSSHLLLNIFAPRRISEFARILNSDGLLLIVIPASDHLAQLRQAYNLLAIQPEKEQLLRQQMQSHFSLRQKTTLRFELNLENEVLHNLIQMTPNARHVSEQTWQQIKKQTSFGTEACFEILEFSAIK